MNIGDKVKFKTGKVEGEGVVKVIRQNIVWVEQEDGELVKLDTLKDIITIVTFIGTIIDLIEPIIKRIISWFKK